MSHESSAAYPQEQVLDAETIRRWRSEAITTSTQDRLWSNRTESLCNALLAAKAERDDFEQRLHAHQRGEL